MKRKEFIRQLKKDGCILLRSGARHDIYMNPATDGQLPAVHFGHWLELGQTKALIRKPYNQQLGGAGVD